MYIATLEASIVWKGKFAENKYLSTDTSPLHEQTTDRPLSNE